MISMEGMQALTGKSRVTTCVHTCETVVRDTAFVVDIVSRTLPRGGQAQAPIDTSKEANV